MEDLSNQNLIKKFPNDSVWVIKLVDGVRTEVIYHGNNIEEANKINEANDSVLVKRTKNTD